MKRKNPKLACVIAVAAGTVAMGLLASETRASTITWTGPSGSAGNGNWSTNADWSGGAAPAGTANTSNIEIDANTAVNSTVTYDETSAVTTTGTLIVDSGDTLQATASAGTFSIGTAGTKTNDPNITQALSNAGTINFAGPTGKTWTIALTGNGNTITGGVPVYSTNTGLIESTGGGTLTLSQAYTGPGLQNTGGTIATSGNSTLSLPFATVYGGTITNALGSTINNANSANSRPSFSGVTFTNNGSLNITESPGGGGQETILAALGGTSFTNNGTALFEFSGTASATSGGTALVIGPYTFVNTTYRPEATTAADTSTFYNAQNAVLTVQNNSAAPLSSAPVTFAELDFNTSGSVTNDGTINVITTPTSGVATSIGLGRNTEIGNTNGHTGSIIFNDNPYNFVGTMQSLATHPTLTLDSGQTLSGGVLLGNGQIGITNHGTIHANGTNPIVISTYGGDTFTNNGTLQVDNGSKIEDTDSSLVLSSGSIVSIAIDSNTDTSGLINVTGTLDLSASPTLMVNDVGTTTLGNGTVFTLIDPTSITGTFAGYAQGSIYTTTDGNNFVVSYQNDEVTLTSTIVPEPASLSLLALSALGLLHRRRRQ